MTIAPRTIDYSKYLKKIEDEQVITTIEAKHDVELCKICKLGSKHGGLIREYEKDRKSSNYLIIADLVGIFTVGMCPSIPWVLAQSGWLGVLLILWVGWLTWLGAKYLIDSLYCVPEHRFYDYTSLATHFFGNISGKLMRCVTHFIQICSVGVLVISILENIRLLLINTNNHDFISDNFKLSAFIAILVISIPGYFITSMNDTALISIINPLNVIIIIIVSIVQCRPNMDSQAPIYSTVQMPTITRGLNLILFCFSGILNFPHLERSMKTPKNWNFVAFLGILLAVISFIIIGVLGYWAFGESVNINFFENLPKTWVIPFLTIIVMLQTYSNCLISMILVIDEERLQLTTKLNKIIKKLIDILVYTIPYLIMWLLIISIKFFDTFTNLAGSISGVYISIILPVSYYIMGYGFKRDWFALNGWYISIMLFFGLTVGNYCICQAILDLTDKLN